jgi:hypothetical protein
VGFDRAGMGASPKQRKVVKRSAKLEREVKRARAQVKAGHGPKVDTRDVTKGARKSVPTINESMRSVAKAVAKAKVKPVKEQRSVGGLIENAGRNLKDIVTGLPASAEQLAKATAPDRIFGKGESERARRALKQGIQQHDPAYALGEAVVKSAKGDREGASRALHRAGDNAYERPLDVVSYLAGGAGAAGRGATVLRHAGKGGVEAARARPPLKVDDSPRAVTKAQVKVKREAARAEVRVRKNQPQPGDRELAAKVTRTTPVRKEQHYSANAATRAVQKAREDRKAAKGKDPFTAGERKARRIRKRRFDEQVRNTKAGALHREAAAAEQAHREHKALGRDPLKRAAADLLANDRVRHTSVEADLRDLRATAARRGSANAHIYDRLTPGDFADPAVRRVAAQRRAGLRESEARLKREGYFEGRDGRGTSPEFVAALQPHLARGHVIEVDKDHAPPPAPQPKAAPQPAAATVKAEATVPIDKVQELRRAGARSLKRQIADVDKRIGEVTMKVRRAPVYEPKATETPEQAALRAVTGDHAELRRKGGAKTSGQDPGREHVDVKGEAKGQQRVRVRRAVPVDSERAELQRLREQRAKLVVKLERTVRAGQAHSLKVTKAPDTARKVVPGRASEKPGKGPTKAQLATVAEREAERARMMDPVKVAARVEAAKAAGIDPHPVDVRALNGGSERSAAEPVAKVAGGAVIRPARGEHDQPHHEGQHDERHDPGMPDQPVAHEARMSNGDGAHKRTGVRVQRDGYYWAHGPRAGQRVTEADLAGEQGAFIRGLEHDSSHNEDLTQPRAGRGYSAQDAIMGNLADDRVLATRLDRERQIGLIRLVRNVEHDFALRQGDRTRFPQQRAEQLAARRDGYTTLNVSKDEAIVVPNEIAARWKAQINPPARAERIGRYITRQFVRTVLPFSMTWQVGNVADLYTRLVAADARFAVPGLAGRSGRDLVDAVRVAMRELDPHLADELTDSLKGHFGARSTVKPLKFSDITHDARSGLVRGAGEFISSIRDLPGIHQAANAVRGATDKLFAAGTRAESAMVSRAAGSAMQSYAKALGHDLSDLAELGRKLAGEFADDPAKLLEFQRRTLEITGDYVTRGPGIKLTQHVAVPFIQWIKAANKFVFHTLPVGHPYKTAMMLWAASITEPERRRLGLSGYISPAEAKRLGLKAPQTGYLAGALSLPGGKSLPTTPLTSLGEAASIIEGAQAFKDGPAEGARALIAPRVAPQIVRPALKALDYGAGPGASAAADAFVPGAKQTRRALEGERSHPRSTLLHPIGTGGKSTSDRILAAMTAPTGREYPERQPKPGSAAAARVPIGHKFPFSYTGPGGKKRTIMVTRTH